MPLVRTVDELNDWLKRASAASRHAQVFGIEFGARLLPPTPYHRGHNHFGKF